ncbi:MAG: LuxR family transcriptional regulator [Deinococcus-Thermus bacterium]|jgi:DNA-binding NarL/FixJ family response regulator|uniref:response regulator transcription factor n=1 Tax=Meiothermus luteus TaxID=2026184 RepID=UPI000E64B298|nr:helix-turn-helix transcriptional regulator [Meiothermus luteus]RMH57535.1 MAG: LuxR family transcriptional regulator [Deinococcota bacterium]
MFGRHAKCRRKLITPAERRVLELVAKGCTNRQIAAILAISPSTVSLHRSKVMRKLGLRSPTELSQFAAGYLRLKALSSCSGDVDKKIAHQT